MYIAGFAVFAITCGALYYVSAEDARRNAVQNLVRELEFRADTVRHWLDTKEHALLILGATIEEVVGDGPVPQEFLGAYKHDPEVHNILLGLDDGSVTAGIPVLLAPDPAQDREWLLSALQTPSQQSAVGPFVAARTGSGMVFTIATPLRYRDGSPRGVLAFCIAQSTLTAFTQKLPSLDKHVLLIDGQRQILVPLEPAGGFVDFQNYPGSAQLYDQSRLVPKGVFEISPQDGAHIFAYAAIPGTDWVLALHAPESVVMSGVTSLQHIFLLFCIIAVACIGYLIRRSWTHDKYKHLSLIDQLTRVGSRAAYEEAFKNLRRKADFPVALLICDMDNLKVINDNLGHATGDLQLQRFSAVLNGCLRGADAVFRLGGDEFAILVHNTNENTATQLSERITRALLDASLAHPDKPTLAASIGTALAQHPAELNSLYRRTDEAMYAQKITRKSQAGTPASSPEKAGCGAI